MLYQSTKIIELGSCAFRQWRADSHCKFIHGYRLVAKFWFACTELDERNWVVDFGGLKDLKKVLENQFDHTFCIAADDPLRHEFEQLHRLGAADLRIMERGVGIERTAEWCLNVADTLIRNQTNNRCWVEKVEVWEHEKNSALAIASNIQTSVPAFSTAIQSHNTTSNSETQATTMQPPISQVRTFLQEVQNETGVNLDNVIKQAPPTVNQPRPAQVGNKTSSGYGNLFGGTSWGL
jgi:6-pyruvoyltetrahydropterin/6-carboxytetrahydropterin synthase